MDAKKILTNKSFCVLPWTGFELEPNGDVKNCIMSKSKIGNIEEQNIENILSSKANIKIKKQMLGDKKPKNCSGCYLQEQDRKNLSSISSRLYYTKELGNFVDNSLYDQIENFSLHHVDLRWTNHCNQACVYCGPSYSSKWAQELGKKIKSNKESRKKIKDFVFKNIKKLKNVYLAGGEPLLMNENQEFLQFLLKENSLVNLRVNTNLSSTKTRVFDLLCKFKNVHWTISAEAIEKEYEYIRYHGSWKDFLQNLKQIQKLNHKITFNMLYFILNYQSIFTTINFFKEIGFHQNSFVIGPLYTPEYLNILNLPDPMLNELKNNFNKEINVSNHYLKNSYENILKYISNTNWNKNINNFKNQIQLLDKRRKQSAQDTFPILFKELKKYD
jgi:radical SAM protein with 4Fe4S-binding SPASM domain